MPDINQTAQWVTARLTELGNATNEGLNTLVTDANIGNYSAGNVSSVVAVENGGTGANNAADALSNLGGITSSNVSAVGKTGDYNDLLNKPTIPTISQSFDKTSANGMSGTAVEQVAQTLAHNFAQEYSASSTYTKGDMVIHDHVLYQANQDISTAEAWTAAHWTAVNVGDQVSDLKSALKSNLSDVAETTGIEILPVTGKGKYITTSGSSVTMEGGVPVFSGDDANFNCIIYACSPDDVFTINALGGIGPRTACFIKSDGTVLSKTGENYNAVNFELTAPANTAFLIINTKTNELSYKGKYITTELSDIKIQNEIISYIQSDNKFPYDTNIFGTGEISNGIYYPASRPYRCCTKKPLTLNYNISITPKTGYRFYPHIYENNAWVGKGWQTGLYTIPHGTKFAIVFAKVTEDTSSTADVETFFKNFIVTEGSSSSGTLLYVAENGLRSVNHRGYNTVAPENTLPAYVLSRKNGFKYVETDIEFTADDPVPVPVLMHDSTINRTCCVASDGSSISESVPVSSKTYTELQDYDACTSAQWATYKGTKIPTLDSFLALCKNLGLHAYIELKDGYSDYTSQLKIVYDSAVKYGMTDKITWISARKAYLAQMATFDEKARLGLVTNGVTSSIISDMEELQTGKNEVFIDSNISNVDATAVDLCVEAKIPLEVWTVDDASTIISMNPYITGVTSNRTIAGYVLYENSIVD